MNALAQIFGSLLMYGVGKNHGLSLEPWRVLFIICGALTAACGVLFLFIMPSGPKDAWFLNAREKEVLTIRMTESHEGGDKTNFSLAQLREALLDPKAWLIFWFGVLVTMQSPVLTVSALDSVPLLQITYFFHSLHLSLSKASVTTNTRQCCIPRLPEQCNCY